MMFIDGEVVTSREGTTQGDPLAMAMYAIATMPLIRILDYDKTTQQIWYADDSSAAGSIPDIQSWWDGIEKLGPAYGYYAKAAKRWLFVKEEYYEDAKRCFEDTEIKVTTAGKGYLGSVIGEQDFTEAFVRQKVHKWELELEKLTSIAKSQPQTAYSALVHSLKNKWSYLSRTTGNITHLLQPVEDILRHHLIRWSLITGRQAINDDERQLFSLPARMGGLGIDILPNIVESLNATSKMIT